MSILLLAVGGMLVGGGVKGALVNRKAVRRPIEHTPVYSRG